MTALGEIRVERFHASCPGCGQPQFAADRLLGLDGWLTSRAERLCCLAGIHDPFRKAEHVLQEMLGWSVDAETIRRRCHAHAKTAKRQRAQRGGLPEQFAAAKGDRELHIDAGKVNTLDGWREVKVGVFCCRERAEPATIDDYEQRDLPAPSVRSVVAEVEEAPQFGQRLAAEALRLGVPGGAGLSVLGDGAVWIWNQAEERFCGAAQVLDVYHGVQHLADAARDAFREEEAQKRWLEDARRRLIGDGYCGVCEALAQPVPDEVRQRLDRAASEVLNYFCGHQGRLGYALRLRRGQAIGSGLVEGTIKQRVNLRMKRTGARWKVVHVGAFVEFHAMADNPEWSEYWAALAS